MSAQTRYSDVDVDEIVAVMMDFEWGGGEEGRSGQEDCH